MTKGYWIARIDVADPERYRDYVAAARPAFERFGARVLARGGAQECAEGDCRGRNVVIEFETLELASQCYHSPEYQAAKTIRQACASGEIVLVEGL